MALALKFIDGADHYAAAQIVQKWSQATYGVTIETPGRGGVGSAFKTSARVSVTLDAQPAWLIGFGFKCSGLQAYAIVSLLDTANGQIDLRMKADGTLSVTRNGTELANSGAVSLLTNTWYHIAFAALIHNTAGTYDVWLNGVKVITGTGADTYNTGNVSANVVALGYSTMTYYWVFDDLYMLNGATYTDADYPGDCRVTTSLPNASGNYGQWTGAYTDVDDATPDDDTTYLADSTGGNKSTFPVVDITGVGIVKAVQVNLVARKDDAGARSIAAVARNGTTDVVGATQATATSYVDYREILLDKPGGTGWTLADVNASEFGVDTVA